MISSPWYTINVVDSVMFGISQKLKKLKNPIRDFSRNNYSYLEKKVSEAHEDLLSCHNQMLANPTPSNAEIELEALCKWLILAQAEESFFCQRSRVTWLGLGDSNTTYFHRMVNTRNSINRIHYLVDSNETRIDTQLGIHEHCISYLSSLLGGPVEPQMFDQRDLDLILPYSCSVDHQRKLVKPFSKEEIKAAFFSLPRNKTSGPDGYSSEFFISCWVVVGVEVVEGITEFFEKGTILKQ